MRKSEVGILPPDIDIRQELFRSTSRGMTNSHLVLRIDWSNFVARSD
jgi:hypothetical protein